MRFGLAFISARCPPVLLTPALMSVVFCFFYFFDKGKNNIHPLALFCSPCGFVRIVPLRCTHGQSPASGGLLLAGLSHARNAGSQRQNTKTASSVVEIQSHT
jgi:hypothetical protein